MCFNQGCRGLVPRRIIRSDFGYWALLARRPTLEAAAQGTTFVELSTAKLRAERIPIPDLATQSAIADFLDRETARIDQLIEKKERLMETLENRFIALVTRGVTGRLCHDGDRIDSQVPYLGAVPHHWNVAKVGARYWVQLGKMLDTSKITGSDLRPYLRVFDVQWGKINTQNLPQMDFSEADRRKFRLKNGDLIVTEGGHIGRSAIWEDALAECYYQKALHRLRPRDDAMDTAWFFYYVMRFAVETGVFVSGGNQTTIGHLTAEALRRYRFAFPPLAEQVEIANTLRKAELDTARLSARISRSIERLRELRSALITAAVTGQIDVATWGKRGETDRRLEAIERELEAEREEVAV